LGYAELLELEVVVGHEAAWQERACS